MAEASTIKIKRSGVSGNPTTLKTGELAYSWFEGEGGNRLYIGTGTESEGNAANHVVIGGKFFTDMLDHTAGTLTGSSAIIVDADKKINEIITPSIHNDENLTITAPKVVIQNAYVGDENTSLQQFVQTQVGEVGVTVSAGTGIAVTGEGKDKTIALTDTGVTAQQYGSTTEIPVITVDAQGRITAAETAEISTTLNFADGASGSGSVDLASGSLKVAGSNGVAVTASADGFAVSADASVVRTSGAQTIADLKTFSALPQATAVQSDVITGEANELVKLGTVREQTVYTDTSANGATVSVGGITKGKKYSNTDIIQVLDDLLHPYVSPSGVSLSLSETGGVFECGVTKTVSTGTVRWTNGSQNITKAEILQGGSPVAEAPVSGSATSIACNPESPITVKTNTTFTARVTDPTKQVSGGNVSYTFVYPFYHGIVTTTSPDEGTVKALTKDITAKGNKAYTQDMNANYACIAYPKSYGVLKSILDPSGFENIGSFTRSEIQITGLDSTAQTYYVYVSGLNTANGYQFRYNF